MKRDLATFCLNSDPVLMPHAINLFNGCRSNPTVRAMTPQERAERDLSYRQWPGWAQSAQPYHLHSKGDWILTGGTGSDDDVNPPRAQARRRRLARELFS